MYENGKSTLFKRETRTIQGVHWTLDYVQYEQRRNVIKYWRAFTDYKSQYFVGTSKDAVLNQIRIINN